MNAPANRPARNLAPRDEADGRAIERILARAGADTYDRWDMVYNLTKHGGEVGEYAARLYAASLRTISAERGSSEPLLERIAARFVLYVVTDAEG